jgi:hypothetical protein
MRYHFNMRWAWTIFVCVACFGQSPLRQAVQAGRDLSADQAETLERQLAANPAALDARARLIGYYFRQVQKLRQDTPDTVRAARGRHLRWFVENDPGSDALGTGEAFAMSGWLNDPENHKALRTLWLAEVERSPDKLPVLMNAAYLLQQGDRPAAVKLVRRAYEITSGRDLRVANYYGLQLGLLWLSLDRGGSTTRKDVEAEIDAHENAWLLGSAGHAIMQYSNPGGEAAEYARQLLHKASALTSDDRMIQSWERDLQRIQSGMPAGSLDVPGGVQLAKLISRPGPDVPAPGGIEGAVLVLTEIAADGMVANTIAISGPKELRPAAAAAVSQWRFEPTLVNGKPVRVFSTFEVRLGR